MPHRPALDPDAAARVAAFGPPVPIRERGLQSVRDALESAPLPADMPTMAEIDDTEAVAAALRRLG